jgi:hypothetical protein
VDLHPKGEIGILENVRQSIVNPDKCLFISVKHQDTIYLGRLCFDDADFCNQVFELLKANCGHSLQEIGQLDIP